MGTEFNFEQVRLDAAAQGYCLRRSLYGYALSDALTGTPFNLEYGVVYTELSDIPPLLASDTRDLGIDTVIFCAEALIPSADPLRLARIHQILKEYGTTHNEPRALAALKALS